MRRTRRNTLETILSSVKPIVKKREGNPCYGTLRGLNKSTGPLTLGLLALKRLEGRTKTILLL